jgi:hypothetical protein
MSRSQKDFDWHEQQVARFSTPDTRVEVIMGREWSRIHPRVCPCGRTFYTWMPLDALWQLHVLAPADRTHRETCGHPFCHQAEIDRVFFLIQLDLGRIS